MSANGVFKKAKIWHLKTALLSLITTARFFHLHMVQKLLFWEQFFELVTFSHPCNDRESIVFGSNFQSGGFDGFTHYEIP